MRSDQHDLTDTRISYLIERAKLEEMLSQMSVISKSDFIRKFRSSKPTAEIIQAAKEIGMTLTGNHISQIRCRERLKNAKSSNPNDSKKPRSSNRNGSQANRDGDLVVQAVKRDIDLVAQSASQTAKGLVQTPGADVISEREAKLEVALIAIAEELGTVRACELICHHEAITVKTIQSCTDLVLSKFTTWALDAPYLRLNSPKGK